MVSVIATPHFSRSAKRARVSQNEMEAIVSRLSEMPDDGDLIKGAGGARKVRIAREGGGKSGGYRVITYFGGESLPVYLLELYSKADKETLSSAEIRELRGVCKAILASFRERKA
jgi:hypothetical protein